MVLFLDYDGVLHPDAVYSTKGRPILNADGELFMWAPLLIDVLAEYPDVKIVLSTSWVKELRFSRAKAWLPEPLRSRVIGATWHSGMARHPEAFHRLACTWWDNSTRYEQIIRYVARSNLLDWIAVDDHPDGWAASDLDRLVKTNSDTGLSDPAVQESLREKLSQNVAIHRSGRNL